MLDRPSSTGTAKPQILLVDIGNTHVHLGLANHCRIWRRFEWPTRRVRRGLADEQFRRCLGSTRISGAILASVVPSAIPRFNAMIRRHCGVKPLLFSAKTILGIGLDYPSPQTIGADRLANALAARTRHGAPVLAVDFGTATTFDVVNSSGAFIGGAIAPGPSLMTAYLHEKTALLPAVSMREIKTAIGRNTVQAIQAGALHGYCGLVRGLVQKIKQELGCQRLPVVATGRAASFLAPYLPDITAVEPDLTLEGLRLCWLIHNRQ